MQKATLTPQRKQSSPGAAVFSGCISWRPVKGALLCCIHGVWRAKWGEGDPRWLVQDRGDGKNVNGWHWTEKNCTSQTKRRIQELLQDLPASVTDGSARITSLKDLTGEVVVNTRKGNKRLVIYDISVTLSWVGELRKPLSRETEAVKGEVRLAELANDNDISDYLYEVTTEGQGQAHDRLKTAVQSMRNDIIERLHLVLHELQTVD